MLFDTNIIDFYQRVSSDSVNRLVY